MARTLKLGGRVSQLIREAEKQEPVRPQLETGFRSEQLGGERLGGTQIGGQRLGGFRFDREAARRDVNLATDIIGSLPEVFKELLYWPKGT